MAANLSKRGRTLRYRTRRRITDPLADGATRMRYFRRQLINNLALESGQRFLDLGTRGLSLARAVRQAYPDAKLYALSDRDDDLALAQRRWGKEDDIQWEEALPAEIPFKRNSFDKIASSLYLHRLEEDERLAALKEIKRVLKRNGEFHWLDWGAPSNFLMKTLFVGVRLRRGLADTRTVAEGSMSAQLHAAGFKKVQEKDSRSTVGGTIRYFVAR